jgi:hypothetical protein
MKGFYAVLFIISIFASTKTKAQVNVNDSLAVVDLYKTMDGANWLHKDFWLTKAPLDSWYGITVENGRVTVIYLDYDSLKGTIPSSIGKLGMLQYLRLNFNNITGTIPSEIGKLTNLTELFLYDNYLTGSIPFSIGNCVSLGYLNLSYNQLTVISHLQLANLQTLAA